MEALYSIEPIFYLCVVQRRSLMARKQIGSVLLTRCCTCTAMAQWSVNASRDSAVRTISRLGQSRGVVRSLVVLRRLPSQIVPQELVERRRTISSSAGSYGKLLIMRISYQGLGPCDLYFLSEHSALVYVQIPGESVALTVWYAAMRNLPLAVVCAVMRDAFTVHGRCCRDPLCAQTLLTCFHRSSHTAQSHVLIGRDRISLRIER
eukprot:IDg10985t1